jgi:gas vesicle protein
MNARSPYLMSILGFLAGGIAGAGIALLLAPQSGKATREMMARKVSDGAHSARSLGDRVVARGEQIWDETALRVGDAASALSGTLERSPGRKSEAPPA